jgi:hypothetical protein
MTLSTVPSERHFCSATDATRAETGPASREEVVESALYETLNHYLLLMLIA